jgi:hypothetical protein
MAPEGAIKFSFAAKFKQRIRERLQHILRISLYQQTSRRQSGGTTVARESSRAIRITTCKIGRVTRINLRIR